MVEDKTRVLMQGIQFEVPVLPWQFYLSFP
jgi:hypothetical protein